MLQFPYGISDFYQIMTEGFFYVDRTELIRKVERIGKVLLFLRPRRFGKSLWLSILENYYDVAKADEFEQLFGSLAICSDAVGSMLMVLICSLLLPSFSMERAFV